MFLIPNKPIKTWKQNQNRIHQFEIKPIKPMWKKKKSKLINPSNKSTHQMQIKPKPNQADQPINAYETKTKSNPSNKSTHQMQIKPKPNQTDQPIYQQNQIKPINPSINKTKSNPSNGPTHQMQIKPINPSITVDLWRWTPLPRWRWRVVKKKAELVSSSHGAMVKRERIWD